MELEGIRLSVYDCEVFAHDWLVVFKQDGAYRSIWNDNAALRQHMDDRTDEVFVGFNSKHYDQYILKAIYAGCTPEEVKEVNDHIIGGEQGWTHPYIENLPYRKRLYVHNTDLMDDMQKGTSLKSIEGHLGMSVEESSVPFDFPDRLDEGQREEVERYCRHDVDATERLLELRWDYLETKLYLAAYADLDPYKALGMTDPKLAAALLRAQRIEGIEADERDYEFPEQLDYSVIPRDVVEYFERIRDESVSDEELFSKDARHVHEFEGCEITFGFGGLHGAVAKLRTGTRPGRMVLNYDVGSLYPSIMISFGCLSRAVPSVDVFKGVRDDRFAAKASADKRKANALKSPLNKAFGAMGNQYNDLYDPKNKLSVCVNGQLAVAELLARYERVEGLEVVQANTDGIAIDIPEEAYEDVLAINREWSERVEFTLDEDRIDLLWQKDVNNYAMRKTDGTEKVKGVYLARGISPVGAWSINNNATIVAEALKRYLLDDVPVADTIDACDDPRRFQLIAKAGGKYSRVYQHVYPEPVGEAGVETVGRQKCNRVFATWDRRYGRLYKVKKADGSVAKVESLPEHCLVWNGDLEAEPPPMSLIDKDYYIALAERRAHDFERKEAHMAATTGRQKAGAKEGAKPDYSKMNVYQKLALARRMVLDAGITKSGKNNHLEFDFFELEDIVPTQTRVFEEVGLIEVFDEQHLPDTVSVMEKDGEAHTHTLEGTHRAVSTVVNLHNPEDFLEFFTDWAELAPIVSKKTGQEAQNALQRKGSETTYLRRYNKLKVLDLVESDVGEARSGNPADSKEQAASASKAATTRTKAAPPTEAEKKVAAKKVTKADGAANNLQVTQLKKAIKALKEAHGDDPGVSSYIAEVGVQTNNLKDITKAQAEEAIRTIGEMKERLETEGGE